MNVLHLETSLYMTCGVHGLMAACGSAMALDQQSDVGAADAVDRACDRQTGRGGRTKATLATYSRVVAASGSRHHGVV